MQALFDCLEWAKSQGYTYADEALKVLSALTGKPLAFKETVWSGGSYYKIIEEVK